MNIKKLLIVSLILLISFGVGIRLISLDKDFTGEETDFVRSATAIKDTGRPIYYLSEQQPNQIGLLHPPTYIYILSLVLNDSIGESSARIINVIFSVLTAILIFLFCIKFLNSKNKKTIGLIASALFLINYFIFSSSLMLDIDNLSMFFTFAFVFCILMDYKTKNFKYFILSILALFFSISNRYPIAFVVFVSLGIYFLADKELRKYFKRYFVIGLCAGISFIVIWGFYSTVIEPGTFFMFIKHNANLGTEVITNLLVYIGSFMLNISQFVRLFTLPFVILMVLSLFLFIRKSDKPIRVLLIYSLSIFFLFIIISRPAFGYPRYFLTMFPATIILISLFVYENLEKVKITKGMVAIVILSFILSLSLLLVLHPQSTFYETKGLIKSTNLPDFIFNLFASFPLFFAFLFKDKKKSVAILVLLSLVLSYSIYFDISLVNHDPKTEEAGTYIKEHTSNSDIIVCPKAVCHYAERRFYLNDFTKPSTSISSSFLLEYFKRSLENRDMSNEFFWEKGYFGGFVNPKPSQAMLDEVKYMVLYHSIEGVSPEAKIGDFYIYKI